MDELKQLIPGFLQGITRVTISYPFDVIKTNMQKLYFKTTKETLSNIVKTDPFKLYRGSSLSYCSVGVERSVQFYLLEKMNKKYNPYINSFIVSIFSSIYNIPVQYLTTNIAISENKVKDIGQYIKTLYKNKTNFYRGYLIEMIRGQLGSTLFMGSYYFLRNNIGEQTTFSPIYGGISGLIVWSIIFPLDTIRTEYQTENKTIKKIINERKKNIRNLYRGITPVFIRTIPSASLGMYVYEKSRNYINSESKSLPN